MFLQVMHRVLGDVSDAQVVMLPYAPTRRFEFAHDIFHQRRFTRPVGADDGDARTQVQSCVHAF